MLEAAQRKRHFAPLFYIHAPRAGVAQVDGSNDHAAFGFWRLRIDQLASIPGGAHEITILGNLLRWERMGQGPIAPITERGPHRKGGCPRVLPGGFLGVDEDEIAIAGNGLAGLLEMPNLLGKPPRSAPIVVIPMGNDLSAGLRGSEIAFLADVAAGVDMDESDIRLIGNDVLYVLAIRDDQKLFVRIGLLPEASDRLRKPLAPVARQAQRRYQREIARPRRASPPRQ